MKNGDLIKILSTLPLDKEVLIPGYEGDATDIKKIGLTKVTFKENEGCYGEYAYCKKRTLPYLDQLEVIALLRDHSRDAFLGGPDLDNTEVIYER